MVERVLCILGYANETNVWPVYLGYKEELTSEDGIFDAAGAEHMYAGKEGEGVKHWNLPKETPRDEIASGELNGIRNVEGAGLLSMATLSNLSLRFEPLTSG